MFRRHHLFASLSFVSLALITVALSAGATGCSTDQVSTPRVTFESEIQPGTHSAKDCGKTGTWFTIGSFGNPKLGRRDPANPESDLISPVVPVDDGADDQQGKASVSCSVVGAGDGFDVAVHAELTGATGGAMTITGHFTAAGDQPNITATFTKQGETFTARDCVARYDTMEGHAVAGGRIWAEVDCANAQQMIAQQTCKSHAQFRFENCTQ